MGSEVEKNDFGLRPWDLTSGEIEPPKELNSYQKLFMAILMDAIATLKHPKTHVRRYVGKRVYKVKELTPLDPIADAWNWILSDDEDWCLAFAVICQHFGWDHRWVREKALEAIQQAKEQGGRRRNRVATDGKRRRKWA